MSIERDQSRRSIWKSFLTIVLCGIWVIGLGDRANSEVTTRQTGQVSSVDRENRIAFARISLKNSISKRDRVRSLYVDGAVSIGNFLDAQKEVTSEREALTAAICDLPISPKISAYQANIVDLIRERNRYQLLANEGVISRRDVELKQEKVLLAQEELNIALRNEPTSQRNLIKMKQCREQELFTGKTRKP